MPNKGKVKRSLSENHIDAVVSQFSKNPKPEVLKRTRGHLKRSSKGKILRPGGIPK